MKYLIYMPTALLYTLFTSALVTHPNSKISYPNSENEELESPETTPATEFYPVKSTIKNVCSRGDNSICVSPACVHSASKIIAKLDRRETPCNDFFKYACGGWQKAQALKLGEDDLYYGINQNEMPQAVDNILQRLITKKLPVKKHLYETPPYKSVDNLYDSCMDVDGIKSQGIQPVVKLFNDLKYFHINKPFNGTSWSLEKAIIEILSLHGAPLFELSIDTNYTHSSKWGIVISSPKHTGILQSLLSPVGIKQHIREQSWLRSSRIHDEIFHAAEEVAKNVIPSLVAKTDQFSGRHSGLVNDDSGPNHILFYEKDSITNLTDFSQGVTTIPSMVPTEPDLLVEDTFIDEMVQMTLEIPTLTRSQFYSIIHSQTSQEDTKATIEYLQTLWSTILNETDLHDITNSPNMTMESFAKTIMSFILQLHEIEPTDREEMLHIQYAKLYNFYSIPQLQAEFPFLDWREMLNNTFHQNLPEDVTITVHFPFHLHQLNSLISVTDAWIIHYGLLSLYAHDNLLELTEIGEDEPREIFCYRVIREAFPDVLSNMYMNYVGRKRLPYLRSQMSPIIETLVEEFQKLILSSSLPEHDKKLAIEKVDSLDWQIGGTESYFNISEITRQHEHYKMSNDSFFDNIIGIFKISRQSIYQTYGQPVENEGLVWSVTTQPYVINAFYLQSENSIVVPSAFFVPPYFYPDSVPYINFGGIGTALAHELFHTLDYSGTLFDKFGDYTKPFSPSLKTNLTKNLQCFNNLTTEHFSETMNLGGLTISLDIDQEATMNENFADILGLKTSFNAHKSRATTTETHSITLPGMHFNADQLFFLSFAQPYCSILPGLAKVILMEVDEHLPHDIRINSLLKNFPAFTEAFQCSENDKMFSDKECPLL